MATSQYNHLAPTPSGASVPKRVKFGWSAPGDVGEFLLIDKNQINIDHANYQRAYSHGRSVLMARRFSWRRFEVIIVALRNDGSYWVIEGQHRLKAAMLRDDVTLVPCLVFLVDDIKEEAKTFVDIGTGSKALTSLDKFQPAITAGDESAILVNDLLVASDYRPNSTSSAGSVKCLKTLVKLAKEDAEALKELWPLLVQVHAGKAIHQRLVEGLAYLHKSSGGRILKDPYRRRLVARGRDNLIADANKAAQAYSTGGAKVWAAGIAGQMSKGLRDENKILINFTANVEA